MLSSKHGGQVLGAPRDPAGRLSGSFREKPETCRLSVGNAVTLHVSAHVCSCVCAWVCTCAHRAASGDHLHWERVSFCCKEGGRGEGRFPGDQEQASCSRVSAASRRGLSGSQEFQNDPRP